VGIAKSTRLVAGVTKYKHLHIPPDHQFMDCIHGVHLYDVATIDGSIDWMKRECGALLDVLSSKAATAPATVNGAHFAQ